MAAKGWTASGITKQVKRLRSLPRKEDERPWSAVGPEFERILQELSVSDEHTERIVTYIVDSARFCPAPFELRELAACVATGQEELRADPLCQICGGDGWRTITRSGLSGVERCKCWAPRPAPKMEFVPLAGQPGYVLPDKSMPKPTDEDRAEAIATGIHGGDAA